MTHDPRTDHECQVQAESIARGQAGATDDPTVVLYRDIFDILGEPVPIDLPVNFSARVAWIAAAAQGSQRDRWDGYVGYGLWVCLAGMLAWSAMPLLRVMPSLLSASTGSGAGLIAQGGFVLASVCLIDMLSSHRRLPK